MKFQKLKKPFYVLSIALTFANCQTNEDMLESSKLRITDFKATELVKMHDGSEKSWILTQVILPEEYKDSPNLPNNNCVFDDTYTFKASATNKSVENVTIELGANRCFETISDSENFEAKLLYVPYTYKGEPVIETTLILKYTWFNNSDNSSVADTNFYRLSELTEDRMVFSTGAEYVGEYTFAYVFEKK